jgi:hypothetical protein
MDNDAARAHRAVVRAISSMELPHSGAAYVVNCGVSRVRRVFSSDFPQLELLAGMGLSVRGCGLALSALTIAILGNFALGRYGSGEKLRLNYGEHSMMLPGDAEKQAGSSILSDNGETALRADVLKVGHHGRKNSTMPGFLAAVRPRVAVISAGKNNPYGHPNPELLKALLRRGSGFCGRTATARCRF